MDQYILQEIKEMRSLLTSGQRDIGERLARIETYIDGLVGNGQPGRITKIEDAIKSLESYKWRTIGIVTGISGVITTGIELFLRKKP